MKTGVCNYLYGRDVKATGKFCAGGVVDACQVRGWGCCFHDEKVVLNVAMVIMVVMTVVMVIVLVIMLGVVEMFLSSGFSCWSNF